MENNKKMRFGIIGCGRIAPKHAESIIALEEAELVAICDIVPELAQDFANKYGAVPYGNYQELLDRKDIDIVTIATPSDLHAQIGCAAARAGKHVIVEKPMAMSLTGADQLISSCQEAGVKLAVIYQNRFNQSIKRLRKALE